MKKHLLITALILTVSANCSIAEGLPSPTPELDRFEEQFYEAPSTPAPEVNVVEGSIAKPIKTMPLFKKTRIKVTNYLRERDYNKAQKLLEKEKKLQNSDDTVKNEVEEAEIQTTENTQELQGGVSQQVTTNNVQLDADVIDYDEKTMDLIATGSPVLTFPAQGTTIKAEKIIYNTASNTLKASKEVEIIKNGHSVFGEDLDVNLNEENAILNNVETKLSFLTVNSRKAEMNEDLITLYDGKMVSKDKYILSFHTKMVGGDRFGSMFVNEEDKVYLSDEIGDTAITIKAKDVIVDAKKNTDTITLKKARFFYDDFKLFTLKTLKLHTNKNQEYFEGNYPEFGSRGKFGMFLGPGYTFDTPLQNGSTLKLIPIVNKKSNWGIGGFLKYRSGTNFTDFGYATGSSMVFLRGKQLLDDKLFMQYGINSYMDEWFLGRRMAKYDAELVYEDKGIIPSSIGDGLDLNFRHRFGFGYMHNSDFNRYGESLDAANIGTTRTRYMAEAAQNLYKYEDKENRKALVLSMVMQGSAALYGTGDTQFIGRIGPRLHTQYKYWMQDIAYFASAYQDNTPLKVYDTYRYGHGCINIREALRLNKYVSLAWSGTINVTGDSPNGKPFQECTFLVSLGPDDFKINLGYDWVREHTYFGIAIAMNTKGSGIEYEKLVIKHPERLAKSDEEDVELKVFDGSDVQAKPKKMMYAEVIDIEDPDREEL